MDPPLEPVVALLVEFARTNGGTATSAKEVEGLTNALLFGERALWRAREQGIITDDEIVRAIVGRFAMTFRVRLDGESGAWDRLRGLIAQALFG